MEDIINLCSYASYAEIFKEILQFLVHPCFNYRIRPGTEFFTTGLMLEAPDICNFEFFPYLTIKNAQNVVLYITRGCNPCIPLSLKNYK